MSKEKILWTKILKLSGALRGLGFAHESSLLHKLAAPAPSLDQFCTSTNSSFAWISPQGILHRLGGVTHEDWADAWVQRETGKKWSSPQAYLLNEGWIAVTSSRYIAIGTWEIASGRAWDTFFELLYSCPNLDWDGHVISVSFTDTFRSQKMSLKELERMTRNVKRASLDFEGSEANLSPEKKKEILSYLLTDQPHFISEEDAARFGDLGEWVNLFPFLKSIGAEVIPMEGDYYLVKIDEEKSYVLDSTFPEFRGNELREWVQKIIYNREADEWVYVESEEPPNLVYHSTDSDNWEEIEANGLECRDVSRGMSNRGIGCAIFVSAEPHETEWYGDLMLEIDLGGMRRDGVMPKTSQEPDIEYMRACSAFANRFGLILGDDVHYDVEQGMFENTFILHGSVPPQYIRKL